MPADRTSRTSAQVSRTSTSSEERTSSCPQCGAQFNRASDAKRHMRTHSPNAEKHKCPEPGCGYEAFQASNLRNHMNIHTGLKPHKCMDDPAHCDFATREPASLTRHRQRKHGYKPPPRKNVSRKGRKTNTKFAIECEDKAEINDDNASPASRDIAIAISCAQPVVLNYPPVATLALAELTPSSSRYISRSPSFSLECESISVHHFYSSFGGSGSSASDSGESTPVSTPLPQMHFSSQDTYLSDADSGAQTSQLRSQCDAFDEPDTLNVFTKNPSDLLYNVDPTVTGTPSTCIDEQSKALPYIQSPELLLTRAPTPVLYEENYFSEGWMSFQATTLNDSQFANWDIDQLGQ